MIQSQHLYKTINKTPILIDVNFRVHAGEFHVLFGASGSGKSTLCRCLSLLDLPDEGEITIDDTCYSFPNFCKKISYPYPKIGFVFQQLFLWPHLTNRQNILLAIKGEQSSYMKKYNEIIDLLDIDCLMERFPNEISQGQKQRIAIARTLMLHPNFIFFDEITSALDRVQTRIILSYLKKATLSGVGIVLITHDLFSTVEYADMYSFMERGKIIESGKEILTSPKSKELKQFILG